MMSLLGGGGSTKSTYVKARIAVQTKATVAQAVSPCFLCGLDPGGVNVGKVGVDMGPISWTARPRDSPGTNIGLTADRCYISKNAITLFFFKACSRSWPAQRMIVAVQE